MKLIDISEPISPATAVFPGDTPYSARWVMRMEQGDSCNVSAITLSPHCGSHADAPLHYDNNGQDMAQVGLDPYLGRCRVVRLDGAGYPAQIRAADLTAQLLHGVERLLIRTRDKHDANRWDERFVALGPEAARVLVAAKIKLVGIDTPSMDHANSKDLPGHQLLESGRVALLENLDLSAVMPGDYELIALPLKIVGGDASPVRAILRELHDQS